MSTGRDFHLAANGSATSSAHHNYSASQRELIKEQLERILVSSLFRNSKRFPEFLRYAVNHALSSETESLKERTIGISVFGRDPGYDTSTDPVVRVTAAEVRKRITQYYQAVGHERELRIEFERGSYVPEFRFCYDADRREQTPAPSAKNLSAPSKVKHWALVASVAMPCLALCIFLLGSTRQTAFDRFWAPVTSTSSPALLCIPDPMPGAPLPASAPAPGAPPNAQPVSFTVKPHAVSLGDSIALSLVSGVLGRKDKDFRVRASEDVTLEDLKEGPVVLIGAFSNRWTMKLVSGLRFTFEHDGSEGYIVDLQNPNSRQWTVSSALSATGDSIDYGIISRVINPTTGHAVVTVAGIHHFGTQAAAECLTETTCLETAAKLAPGDWKRTNVQIVLKTTVIGENSGEPRVLAAYVW
jgi:hypothetical protein